MSWNLRPRYVNDVDWLKERRDLKVCFVDISYRTKDLMKLPRRSRQILRRISARGHEVEYVSISPLPGIGNAYIAYGLGSFSSLLKTLGTGPDVFLTNGLETGALSYLSKMLRRRKFVFDYTDYYTILAHYEGYGLRTYYAPSLQKAIPNLADHVIVVKEGFKKKCLSYGVPESKITIIPDGVDTTIFSPHVKGDKIRQEFRIAENPLVVYVGKVEEYYNLDTLIEAASIVVKCEPSTKFLLVGPGRSLSHLKSLAKKMGLSDSVIFAGFQPYDSIPQFVGAADVAVFPHTAGLAVYEYMASGKPLVKPKERVGEVLDHLESGFLLEDRTSRSFAEGILEILHNKQLAARIGGNARRLAVQKYDWEILADEYTRVLQNV